MNSWEKQSNESSQAFEAFVIYRDMGLQRSIRSAAKTLGKSHKLLERWSAKYKWSDRAAAFDAHMDSITIKANEDARREMSERQAKTGMKMQEAASQALEKIDPASLRVNEALRMAETGVKIERAARGMDDSKPKKTRSPKPPLPEIKVVRFRGGQE